MKLRQIQSEVAPWKLKNFPGEQTHHPLLGIVEEFQELVEARESGNIAAIKDAVADVCIFTIDFCRRHDLDAQDIFDAAFPASDRLFTYSGIVKLLGELCRRQLKIEQGIRGSREEHVAIIRATLETLFGYLLRVRSDVEEIAWATWLHVRERDWVARPETG